MSLLLTTFVSVWTPSPPPVPPPPAASGPPSVCAQGDDPCTIVCTETGASPSPPYTFSLSGFTAQAPGEHDYYNTNGGADNYFYRACNSLPDDEVKCEGGGTLTDPVVIQTWGGDLPPVLPSQCAQLGSLSTQACTMTFGAADAFVAFGATDTPSDPTTPGLSCKYTDGFNGRDVTIAYRCSDAYASPSAHDLGDDHYRIELTGPSACGVLPPPAPMSGGTLFLILFLVR
eukprot:6690860-Prymnesium_polylepis.1